MTPDDWDEATITVLVIVASIIGGVLVLFAVVFFAIGWTRFGHID